MEHRKVEEVRRLLGLHTGVISELANGKREALPRLNVWAIPDAVDFLLAHLEAEARKAFVRRPGEAKRFRREAQMLLKLYRDSTALTFESPVTLINPRM